MSWKMRAAVVAAAMGIAGSLASSPSVASASEVGTQGCQGSGAELRYYYNGSDGTTKIWVKNCSGYYSLNSDGVRLYAGGWSGVYYDKAGSAHIFCDWDNLYLNGARITGIYMAAAKIAECQ
ncbi:hypothetical protein ACFY4C_42210 [Actinomadura viridis]|uniref:hypothetical protein n=1 Tax=Actinomadura viridis TaxID=58110 RepID=UPI00368E54A0